MSGEVIGIDEGPKIPVLTKEEVKDEVKEEVKKEAPKPVEKKQEESVDETEVPVIVPTVPEGQAETTPAVKVPKPEIKKPTVENIGD